MTAAASEFRTGWKVVLASSIGVGVGTSGIAFYTVTVFMKPLAAEFGWSRAAVSAASLFLSLGAALMMPFVGALADRINRRKIILTSLILMVFGYLGLTQVNSPATLYLGLLVLAFGGSGTAPVVWSHLINTSFDRSRGLALGLTLAGSGLSAILAPRLVDKLIQNYGWRGGYVGIAVFIAVIAFPVIFLLLGKGRRSATVAAQHRDMPGFTATQALRMVRFWQLGVGIMLVGGSIAAILINLVPLLTDLGLSRDQATGLAGIMGMSVVFGRIAIGLLVDRFHAPYVAAIVLTIPSIGFCLLAAHIGGSTGILLSTLMFGLSAGAEVDLLAYLSSRFFGLRAYGKIYGLLLVPFLVGAGIGPILLGHVYDVTGNYGLGLYSCSIICLIGAAMIALLGKYPRSFSASVPHSPAEAVVALAAANAPPD